jgi:hemerythrin-like domain-containing protein
MERATHTGPLTDAIQLLTVQHRDAERLWAELETAHRTGAGRQSELAHDLVALLSMHDAIEAQVLYPAVRRLGEEGRALAEHALDDHHRVRDMLSIADGADVRDEQAFVTLETCLAVVTRHVEAEERELFPWLRRTYGPERILELGDELRLAMDVAPTHPHRHMPDNQWGATVAGAVAGIVDRVRDARRGDQR